MGSHVRAYDVRGEIDYPLRVADANGGLGLR